MEAIMRNRAGKPVKKGILFMSSFKSQETLEKMVISTRFLCEKKNILINDVAVECNPTGDMEIDRPCVKALVNTISKGDFEVLVLRNLYDITAEEADWENFLNVMESFGVMVYLTEEGKYVYNDYGEC